MKTEFPEVFALDAARKTQLRLSASRVENSVL